MRRGRLSTSTHWEVANLPKILINNARFAGAMLASPPTQWVFVRRVNRSHAVFVRREKRKTTSQAERRGA